MCVGDSRVAKPLTLVQLMRICSFVEELLLADLARMFDASNIRADSFIMLPKQIPEEPKIKPCPKGMALTPRPNAPPAWF